jgi:hypothetical protein
MAKSSLLQGVGRRTAVGIAAVCGLALMTLPVAAQFGQRGGGMFDFFGPFSGQPRYNSPSERPQDFSKAPPPRKFDNQPANTAVVFGDSMSDWLAHGLEDALGDNPDVAVVRKNRATAGLIRYDSRNENLDWPQVIRETLAQSKPNFVVMMIGLNDREKLRDRPIQSGPPSAASGSTTAPSLVPQAGQPAAAPLAPDAQDTERPTGDQQAATAEKPQPGLRTYEFRTDEWAEHYARRIDAVIAAMKSAGVPVFWVGLPSIRGQKSTSEMLYLNDLFRTRAEKAGVTYIDVWDGFVDESGRFAVQGPDFEGQTRRLRVSDGVHFTKSGARKLAHYLEREMRRVIQRGSEPSIAALPAEPQLQTPKGPGAATARPLSGAVVPLTGAAAVNQDLLGAVAEPATAGGNPRAATRVLIKGEALTPPAGRSDDFRWPRRGVAAFGTDPTVAVTTDPTPAPAAVASTPAPAIATATAPDSKADNKSGTGKKTSGRAQPQQAQAEQPQRRQTQQQPQRRRDDFGGGGGGFFGR